MVDISLVNVVGGYVVGAVAPGALAGLAGDELFELACLIAWVFIESLLLSTIGTTPGKWLLKTRLVPPRGASWNYSTALERSLKVWWRGMGIGLPFVSLITLIFARERLMRDGVTSWDRELDLAVAHERIGPARVIAVCVLYLALSLLLAGSAFSDLDVGA